MKNIINLGAFVAALSLMATAMPGRALASSSEVPVLTQYAGYSDKFFARSDDLGIHTSSDDLNKGSQSGDWSNVLVAVTGGRGQRKIRYLTEVWTDISARPHSVSVLKLQVEYNDALIAKDYCLGCPSGKIDGLIPESGVLDRQTLAIPYSKLNARATSLAKKVDYQRIVASSLFSIDPEATAEGVQFCLYVLEKLRDARSKLALLRAAVDAVPLKQIGYIPTPRAHVDRRDGLPDLHFVHAGLSLAVRAKPGVFYYRGGDHDAPERSIKEFVDPSGMTPMVVSDLLEKEAAAAEAVGIAENLFKDLFTPP